MHCTENSVCFPLGERQQSKYGITQLFFSSPLVQFFRISIPPAAPQWGTADAEIKNPPGGNQRLSNVPSL